MNVDGKDMTKQNNKYECAHKIFQYDSRKRKILKSTEHIQINTSVHNTKHLRPSVTSDKLLNYYYNLFAAETKTCTKRKLSKTCIIQKEISVSRKTVQYYGRFSSL